MEYQHIILDLVQPRSLYNNSPVIENLNIGTRFLITRFYFCRFLVILLFFHSISMTTYFFTSSISSSGHSSGYLISVESLDETPKFSPSVHQHHATLPLIAYP